MRTGMVRPRSASNQLMSVIATEYRTAGGSLSDSACDTPAWLDAARGESANVGCGKHVTSDAVSR